MQRRKDITLEKKLLLPHQLGKVTRPFPNNLESMAVRKILYSVQHTYQGCRSQQVHPRSNCAILKLMGGNLRAASQTLEVTCSMLTVKVHDRTLRKKLDKCVLYRRVVRKKPLLSKTNMAALPQLAKSHLKKPQDLCHNVFLDR